MVELRLVTNIAAPAVACFDLCLSVDAHTNSMATSRERIVAGVRSGVMALGDTVTWQARHFGIRFRMTSKITEYESPLRFVDEQTCGPFSRWWHEHRFEEQDGHTVMTDLVRFRSPVGPVGGVVDRVVLESYMTRLLAERNAWLKSALESG